MAPGSKGRGKAPRYWLQQRGHSPYSLRQEARARPGRGTSLRHDSGPPFDGLNELHHTHIFMVNNVTM